MNNNKLYAIIPEPVPDVYVGYRPAIFVDRNIYAVVELFNLEIVIYKDDLGYGDRVHARFNWLGESFLCIYEKTQNPNVVGFEMLCQEKDVDNFRSAVVDFFELDETDYDFVSIFGSE